MNSPGKIRFAVMCNGTSFQQWQAQALRLLLQDQLFEACLLIVDVTVPQHKSLLKKLSYTLFYNQYERRLLKPSAREQVDLSNELKPVPSIECKVSAKGKFASTFSVEDIKSIKAHQPDLIIRFGFNILSGDILNAAKWGVWSYHHGDPEEFRGGPPGLWEILQKKNTNGAILQRLTEKLDAGVILRKGEFPVVKHSYPENLDNILFGSASWIRTAALNIHFGNIDPDKGAYQLKSKGPVYKRPGNFTMLRFIYRLIRNRLHFYNCKYFYRDMWSSGVTNMPVSELLNRKTVTAGNWVPEAGKGIYLADPFVRNEGDSLKLFAEKFSYQHKQAHIVSTEFDTASHQFSSLKDELIADHHLSYPFLISHKGIDYILPEAWSSNRLTLYKDKNKVLTEVSTLLSIKAVDPTLIEHNGKFWLFCTHREAPSHQLYIYHSEKLEGPYVAHVLNPVKTNIYNSRPAGAFFTHEGELYRPAQNCSRTYGGSVVINKIIQLSETCFEEVEVNEICPDSSWKHNAGLHTLNVCGSWIVFDAKREEFHFDPKGN